MRLPWRTSASAIKFMTNHGQSLPVPKVKGLVYDEATRLLDEKDLRYVVFDSVYMPKAKPNQVVDQNPAEGTKVKKNRIVYLTINARPVPIVKVPDILDIGLREAVSKLTAEGLEVGEITTRADLSVNRVLGISHNGKRISPGDEIEKGSKIDLVISKGEDASDKNIVMPDLVGLTLDEATIELSLLGLNIAKRLKMFKKLTGAIALICIGVGVNAQLNEEVLVPLTANPTLKQQLQHKNSTFIRKSGITDTLLLPFFEDFSKGEVFPDESRWTNRLAYVNTDFPVKAPSIGV
eukprot:gene6085-8246_t